MDTNYKIWQIFSDIADMLEIKGENFFKIRAFRKAAHVIGNMSIDLETYLETHRLEEIEGVGKALAEKIREILNTGTCKYYEELKEEVPRGLVEMLKIPGLGAKRIKIIYDGLNISTIDELEQAAKAQKIKHLPGMGIKTQQTILKGIQLLKGSMKRILLPTAIFVTDKLLSALSHISEIEKSEIAGSLRRKKENIGDIDILISTNSPEFVVEELSKLTMVSEILAKGPTKLSVILDMGVQVDFRLVAPKSFYTALQYFTGSKEHNTKLRGLSQKLGYKLNEYEIFDANENKNIFPNSEEQLYKKLGMPYIIPELREDRGEIEAALAGKLPKVVEIEDIKGDLHVHSNWSDGISVIESLACTARDFGYEYIAITDHSKSLKIANGLDEGRIRAQIEYIRELNQKLEGITVLSGAEVDILSDEILDFDNDILECLDIVVASIHSGFKQDREKIMRRLLIACENPNVDIIAHPTGRVLGKRDPYDVDIDMLLETAAKTKTILEINSSPDRLDLNDINVKKAKAMGVKLSINTDAHSIEGLYDMKYGVWVARRGWLEKNDIINTMPLENLLEYVNSK